jgi:hypothetical protein
MSHLKGIDVLLLGENILEAVPYLGWVEVGGPAEGGAVLIAVHVGRAEALLHVNSWQLVLLLIGVLHKERWRFRYRYLFTFGFFPAI